MSRPRFQELDALVQQEFSGGFCSMATIPVLHEYPTLRALTEDIVSLRDALLLQHPAVGGGVHVLGDSNQLCGPFRTDSRPYTDPWRPVDSLLGYGLPVLRNPLSSGV